jgi:hypothetical protein
MVETFKAKIGAKEVAQKAKLLQLGSEHNAAVLTLNGQLEFTTIEINVGRELSTTSDMLKKLLSNVTKFWMYYNELATQHCDSKSEASCLRKELTTTRKMVQDQLELMLAHKERMKDKEIKREHIHFDKAKNNNYTKLLAKECKHLNIQKKVTGARTKPTQPTKKAHPQDNNG